MDPFQVSIVAFGLLAIAFLLIMTGNRSSNELYVGFGGAVGVVSQALLFISWRGIDPTGANWIVPGIGIFFFGYLSARGFWRWRQSRSAR